MTTNAEPITPPQPRFADAFWDEHHYGVEAIDQRLFNAKQTCEEIKKLYEIRSQMEGDYGDRLLKLSQLIVGGDEDGTLAESLSHIPSALETTARAHMDLAQQLLHHLQSPLDNFIKDQYDLYTAKQRHIQDIIKLKNESYERMIQAKGAYNSECDKLKEIYRYLEEYSPSIEEQNQAEADRDACLKNIEAVEQGYRQSIDVYNNHTTTWVDEWRSTCDVYQDLEEKRIRFVRSSLWAFANMMSSVYIVDDQCCERIRTALELTDVDKDIHSFVKKHGTGKLLPGYAEFQDAMPNISPTLGSGALHMEDSTNGQQKNIGAKALPTVPNLAISGGEETLQHNTAPGNGQGQQDRQTEAMAFAMQAVENMLQDDANRNTNMNEPVESNSTTQHQPTPRGRQINESKPPVTPEPTNLITSSADTKRPSSVKSNESGQLRFKPVPNPAFARNKEANSTPSSTGKNPTTNSDNNDDNDQQLADLISTAALVVAGSDDDNNTSNKAPKITDTTTKSTINNNNNNNAVDEVINLTDDESEDGYKIPVRPPPKDEKWVISSIRRPQMVPVRSTNAHLYDGTSTSRASMIKSGLSFTDTNGDRHRQSAPPIINDQNGSSPDAYTNGKTNKPHPPLKIDIPNKDEAKVAAKEVIAAGRAHTQHISQPNVQEQSQSMGIRPPPWKQEGSSMDQPQPQHYNQHDHSNLKHNSQQPQQTNYDQHQQQQQSGGLQRYGSVSGPRAAPYNVTTDLSNDTNGRNGKNGNEFSKFMKGVLKPNDGGRPLSGDPSDDNDLHPHGNKKDKGGRFSLGIFGNKKDKDKRGRDSQHHQKVPPSDMLISGPPGGGPIITNDPSTANYHNYNYPMNDHEATFSTSVPPTTFIPTIQSEANNTPISYPTQEQPTGPQPGLPHDHQENLTSDGAPIMHYSRAIWSFTATIPLEMSFSAGDRLAIVKKQADGWWDAELQGPKKTRGLVPGNYMENE
ncbi:hypothetical protein BC941DRAFT_497486 [Chlamydoabsidia padenii]|nr:hypothetical protein BC941DRAFT_497486 [Chlamydoabsidia padenii]